MLQSLSIDKFSYLCLHKWSFGSTELTIIIIGTNDMVRYHQAEQNRIKVA